jgi:alkaline phosphatase D
MPDGGLSPDPIAVHWQVSEDESMSRIVREGTATASAAWAHSVHVELNGLRPDRWYWYRFKAGNHLSPIGRTRTFPTPGSLPERLRFAFASCQHYETGLYTAYEHMAREELDLVVHLGDYIYERGIGTTGPRRHNGPEIMTLDDYRARYALYKMDPALQAMHAAAPWIITPDDHEVDNNYANAISEEKGVSPTQLLRRRAVAYQAYYEHMPFRRSALPSGPNMRVYRQLAFGQLANFFVLDTRQYRTDQPCGDGNKPPCAEALSRRGTLMGASQRHWLFKAMDQSNASWNVLAQQVMMARVDRAAGPEITHSMDQWPGYEHERRMVLRQLRDHHIRNPIVLTGDIHSNWANELTTDFDSLKPQNAAVEFVGTSISSGGDGSAAPKELGQLLAQNPCVKFHNQERGYVRCEVSQKEWRSDYRTVEFVSKPGAPIHTRASFLVPSGHSTLIQT